MHSAHPLPAAALISELRIPLIYQVYSPFSSLLVLRSLPPLAKLAKLNSISPLDLSSLPHLLPGPVTLSHITSLLLFDDLDDRPFLPFPFTTLLLRVRC